MTLEEARDLAARITNTWPKAAGVDEWIDVLQNMNVGRAGTTFIRLRNENEHAPSIARYIAVYRSLHTSSDDERCETCGNDGAISGPTFERHGQTYASAIPCPHCEHGRTVARWMGQHSEQQAARRRHDDKPLATVTPLFEDTPL